MFDAPCLLPCVVQYLALMNERLELAATATAVRGIFYFLDAKGHCPVPLEWSMKLWWPHCEAMIAYALVYSTTRRCACCACPVEAPHRKSSAFHAHGH